MADAQTFEVGAYRRRLMLGPKMMCGNVLLKVCKFYNVFMEFKTAKWQLYDIYLSV
jgi:hypothetical protein